MMCNDSISDMAVIMIMTIIQKNTLLRVIPTMTFNSSHLAIYLAYLSGIPSGMSSDVLSGIYIF